MHTKTKQLTLKLSTFFSHGWGMIFLTHPSNTWLQSILELKMDSTLCDIDTFKDKHAWDACIFFCQIGTLVWLEMFMGNFRWYIYIYILGPNQNLILVAMPPCPNKIFMSWLRRAQSSLSLSFKILFTKFSFTIWFFVGCISKKTYKLVLDIFTINFIFYFLPIKLYN